MSKTKLYLFLIAALLVFLVPQVFLGSEKPDDFTMSQIFPIDRGHSYIGFSVKYMGFAYVRGRFEDFSGSIRYDETDITKTSATVIIKTASIDTDHDFRDRDLKSANWFDSENFPTIRFQSKRVVKQESGVEVIGDLTIRGVTKEISLKLEGKSGLQKDVRDDTQIIFTGSTVIDRTEFGVKGERWSRLKEGIAAVVSEVKIELSILAKQINESNFRNRVRNVERPPGKIYKIVAETGVDAALKEFNTMKSESENSVNEGVLNVVGYMLLKEGKVDDAISVFKHNAKTYPESVNVYDSLGEAYGVKGDHETAIKFYKIVLEKDALNANAMEVLRHLKN